jgi:hypothetical protein
MAILTKDKLATYGIEVFVVVFGILIAFQVEEWREDRQRNRDLDAALIRLAEETAANLNVCERVVPRFADHARWVLAVVRVLNEGHLGEADSESFDAGLVRAGYIQGAPYSVTVAEEMIATGLLKDLDDAELRNRIAELPVWVEDARGWLDDTRGSLRMAVAEVAAAVEFQYHGQLPAIEDSAVEDLNFEDGIGVEYEFDELVANATLKNVFIEAADTHLDMWIHHRELCRRFAEIQFSLTGVNRH